MQTVVLSWRSQSANNKPATHFYPDVGGNETSDTIPFSSVPMQSPVAKRFRSLLMLGCILALFVFNVERWNPSAFFGIYHDDSIYLSAAKALAQGQGLTLASFPGNP